MTKKIISMSISFILSLCLLLTVVACAPTQNDGDVTNSDGFIGALSEETYDTQEAAAEAYLNNEISGKSTQAIFVSIEINEQLTQSEIDALPLDESDRELLVKAEKALIYYRSNNVATYGATESAESNDMMSSRIYLMTLYNGMLRYFVPPHLTGEPITKSYFAFITDTNKYLNSTWAVKSKNTGGYGHELDLVIKFADNGFGSVRYSLPIYESSHRLPTKEEEYAFDYGEEELGQNRFYLVGRSTDLNQDERYWNENKMSFWQRFPTYFVSTYDEYRRSWIEEYIPGLFVDYTYFEKTDTGCSLQKSKVMEFLIATNALGNYDSDMTYCDMSEYKIIVENGRIIRYTLSFICMWQNDGYSGALDMAITDFGTTVVNIPNEVLQFVK